MNEVLSEFEILKSLDHPNIVRLHEMYSDEKNFYLISEYCEGGELFDRIKKSKFFSEAIVAKIMFQILSAVIYCHSRNIAHRDLKPENILFVNKHNNDHLKLIDFGVSSNFNVNSKLRDKQGTVNDTNRGVLYRAGSSGQKLRRKVRCLVLWCDPVHLALWVPAFQRSYRRRHPG